MSWTFAEIETTNPAEHGVVVSTTPAPGTPVGQDAAIVVRFGRAP